MHEQVTGWLANNGGGIAGGVAALMHGGLLGGLALLVIVFTFAIQKAGPELRQWVAMVWEREDAKKAELVHSPAADADMPDAA